MDEIGPDEAVQDEIILNGSVRPVPRGCTIAGLVRRLDLDPRWVLAELNGEPVARESIHTVTLAPGDRLELIRPIAGG